MFVHVVEQASDQCTAPLICAPFLGTCQELLAGGELCSNEDNVCKSGWCREWGRDGSDFERCCYEKTSRGDSATDLKYYLCGDLRIGDACQDNSQCERDDHICLLGICSEKVGQFSQCNGNHEACKSGVCHNLSLIHI